MSQKALLKSDLSAPLYILSAALHKLFCSQTVPRRPASVPHWITRSRTCHSWQPGLSAVHSLPGSIQNQINHLPVNNTLFQVIPAYYDAKGALVSLGTGAGVAGGPGGPVRLLASPAPPLPHQVKFISLISILYSNYFQPSLDPQSRQYLPQPHFLAAEETLWTETQTPPSPHPWATTTSRSRVNKELVAGEGSQAMELWARRAWLVSLVPQDPSPLLP